MDELLLVMAALALYAAAWASAWRGAVVVRHAGVHPATGWLLAGALGLHTMALAARWAALGHGPFTTLYEILSSNLWSLTLVAALAAAVWPEVRAAIWAATPVWAVLALWLLAAPDGPGHLPPTYDTPLLYLHTLVGKLYLGLLLVAVALASPAWLQRLGGPVRRLAAGLDPARLARLGRLAHGFAAFAFVFDTLMLIVGAVWAQDAWGRYWAWDPLESWAFASWIALAAVLHAEGARRLSPAAFGLALAGVFALAFLTFFGVPFLSTSPHKGAV